MTLALALVLFSCAKEEKPEYSIISGKITNTEEEGKFTLVGSSFEKEISVNTDGTFTDTLHLDYNGAYNVEGLWIYLHKGKNLTIDADGEKMYDAVFTGDLANENNYLAQKKKISEEILGNPRALYSLEETEFLAKLDSFEKKCNELLESTAFTVSDFKEKEIKNIHYNKEYNLFSYSTYHGYLTGNQEFKVSENFPKTDETIDFDNSDDFNFSTSYRQLASTNFDKKVAEEYNKIMGEDEEYNEEVSNEATLKVFKAIKSQNIKNSLARQLAYGINPANEKSEELYNEIMANVTYEKFKTDLTEKFNKIKALVKGNASPKFNYENHKGGTTSLDDLKGKFVYIDVWATWCGPCVREIPFMKEVEKKYHGKNIEFVSISIDEKKDHEKWKEFVTEKEMGGVQLYADNAWQSQFVQDYAIEGIPRFILIDTEGNIVNADAPRPSDESLIELFDELGI